MERTQSFLAARGGAELSQRQEQAAGWKAPVWERQPWLWLSVTEMPIFLAEVVEMMVLLAVIVREMADGKARPHPALFLAQLHVWRLALLQADRHLPHPERGQHSASE